MKKTVTKILCVVLSVLMMGGIVSALAACQGSVILVWGPDDHEAIYKEYLAEFAETHKDRLAGYKFGYAGSGDAGAYDAMSVDVKGGAGVYTFANDQTANLRNAGALAVVNGANLEWSIANNSAAAVESTKLSDGRSYAYPLQADNGYYMYYNKSAFRGTDVWDEENDCLKEEYTFRDLYAALQSHGTEKTKYTSEVRIKTGEVDKNGKPIYSEETEKKEVEVEWAKGVVSWPMGDSWYGSGVFFAVGGDYNVAYDAKGKQINADAWFGYTLPDGVDDWHKGDFTIGNNAVQCMKNTFVLADGTVSPNYLYTDGNAAPLNDYITYHTDFNDAMRWGKQPLAAVVCGTWKAKELQLAWGDDYAATVLPILENDQGQRFTMKNFAGYKNMGVNPNCAFIVDAPESERLDRLNLLHELAQYLCGPEISIARYKATGAGPANLQALADPEIANDAALLALNAQYDRVCVYPEGYHGYEYEFDVKEVTSQDENGNDVITYEFTRNRVEKNGGDPVGNGKGFRTQDSVPANYWTPIQNFGNTLYNELTGKTALTNFANNTSIMQYLKQLQGDIQNSAQ